jgi:hypothetical protein
MYLMLCPNILGEFLEKMILSSYILAFYHIKGYEVEQSCLSHNLFIGYLDFPTD